MALACVAVWDTTENRRSEFTRKTLESLANTVNFARHRLVISDNGSCDETQYLYEELKNHIPFTVIRNGENIGTAAAINKGWAMRELGEACVKADNDIVIHERDWLDLMEMVFAKDKTIGICGLKRVDLEEWPLNPHPWYKSELIALPHIMGERWLAVEEVVHVMGSCCGFSSALLDTIGGLYQMQDMGCKYGLDDSIASYRSRLAGFKNVFLPHVLIEHIDPGGTEYTEWKKEMAAKWIPIYRQVLKEYDTGERPLYWSD